MIFAETRVARPGLNPQPFPMKLRPALLLLPFAAFAAGCVHRVEVKPIHITVDVNVSVKQAIDDYFGDLDKKAASLNAQP